MSVVDLVGRDQVAHRSQGVDLGAQPAVRLRRGPQEEVPVREPGDHHAGRERDRNPEVGHAYHRPVRHPETLAHRLEGVYGLVEFHGQSIPAPLARGGALPKPIRALRLGSRVIEAPPAGLLMPPAHTGTDHYQVNG